MGFADYFEIPVDDTADRELADRIKQLSGLEWPPKTSAEAAVILTRAGFPQTRIEQFLETVLGVEGLEAGELPSIYISAGKDDWPIFTAGLIEGLERWRRDNPSPDTASATDNRDSSICVDIERQQLTHNGTLFDVRSQQALRWVKVLCDHPGVWISGTDLVSYDVALDGARTDKLRKNLPKEVDALIESEPSRGSRISIGRN